MSPAFDRDELMDRVDGDLEFLAETVEMLDEDAAPLLEQIRAAVAARDAGALVSPAHTLKGMLANFCADAAERVARELEMGGREKSLGAADTLVKKLQMEVDQLRAELQTFLEANPR
jgi:HPt (histidine-containing phosphotransfer) domain-containing protein